MQESNSTFKCKHFQWAEPEQDKTLLQRQIASTEEEIARLVYDLYGFNDDETRIVENQE